MAPCYAGHVKTFVDHNDEMECKLVSSHSWLLVLLLLDFDAMEWNFDHNDAM
jgi:hypothetical protein